MSDKLPDVGAMLAQARELSEKMRRVQDDLRHQTVSATVGGGMVEVTANGALEIVQVVIDPLAVDPRDVVMLQDLVRAAVNQALQKASQLAGAAMQQATGLPLPADIGLGPRRSGGGS
ncbi:MAG: YbaB/EbfC family nucleoid-associated protein [Myxococcota bacterium]